MTPVCCSLPFLLPPALGLLCLLHFLRLEAQVTCLSLGFSCKSQSASQCPPSSSQGATSIFPVSRGEPDPTPYHLWDHPQPISSPLQWDSSPACPPGSANSRPVALLGKSSVWVIWWVFVCVEGWGCHLGIYRHRPSSLSMFVTCQESLSFVPRNISRFQIHHLIEACISLVKLELLSPFH